MTLDLHTLTHTLALANNLEAEGQMNNAKLLRAAVDSLLARAASTHDLSRERPALVEQTAQVQAGLRALGLEPALLQAIERSRVVLEQGGAPLFNETPDPYVCRACGQVMLDDRQPCPGCGAQPATFRRYRPVFWFEALDPFQSLAALRAMPQAVARLLEGDAANAADAAASAPNSGGWSLRQAISHLLDAQGVLDFRANLILDNDQPLLEGQAVYAMATSEEGRPASTREIFEAYRAARAQTLARLESIPLQDWWRIGRHEEFGPLRLYQQVSYFATHEAVHLPQISALVR